MTFIKCEYRIDFTLLFVNIVVLKVLFQFKMMEEIFIACVYKGCEDVAYNVCNTFRLGF